MATLHLINAPPSASDAVQRCFAAVRAGDAIVFYEGGAFSAAALRAQTVPPGVRVFVLRRDADALHATAQIDETFVLIDDAELVDLVVACERSVSWL